MQPPDILHPALRVQPLHDCAFAEGPYHLPSSTSPCSALSDPCTHVIRESKHARYGSRDGQHPDGWLARLRADALMLARFWKMVCVAHKRVEKRHWKAANCNGTIPIRLIMLRITRGSNPRRAGSKCYLDCMC
jgi:hypothetical protein